VKDSAASDWPDDKSHVRSTMKPRPSTADIAEVLARSQSRKEAASALGIPATTLERLCREQALVALYEALARRGNARKGKPRPPAPKPPRWAIVWAQPGKWSVTIWHVDAESEQEALDVAMSVVAKIAQREHLSAVQEVTK